MSKFGVHAGSYEELIGLSERIEEQGTRRWRERNQEKISSNDDDLEFSDYSAAARGDQTKMLDVTSLFIDIYFTDMKVWTDRGERTILERRFPTPDYQFLEVSVRVLKSNQ
ncbi:Uncharacterized protein Rs2_39869 [Raphanus sativus]|nr:hypothetical protein Rs2_50260 [Raphanus sativus]KAJ4874851.1 Uncharacterized protein Rs2_39869 [Raphanus sativus]